MKILGAFLCSCGLFLSPALAETAYWDDVTEGMDAQQVSAALSNLQRLDRLLATLHLARLYSQHTNASPAEVAAAIQLYKEALDSGLQCVPLLSAQVQLASLLTLTGKQTEANTLLDAVIHADPDTIVADELTPELNAGLHGLGAREKAQGMQMDSPLHVAAVAMRLEVFRKNTLESYGQLRRSALYSRAQNTFRSAGLPGVREYANTFDGDDHDARNCL